ncbi:MAG TPA: short-chain dehydrogenase [Cytophagales bacterium]|nr:short-chain dehydrogenase [Cytophagales bacterium]HAP64240.1 short-chain dehydrogenase [Cytophagales bacterium]
MDLELTDTRAWVCGSTQGIGRACAHELALLGASITLIARNEEKLALVRDELPRALDQEHTYLVADFDDLNALRSVIGSELEANRAGDILINNTGGPKGGAAHLAEPEEYSQAFNRHVLANQTLVQALLPHMREGRFGRVINIISTSVKAPIPNLGVSNTIRGAVANWAKTLATEVAPFGITVNNVLPGFTETARLDAIIANRAKQQATSIELIAQSMRKSVPAQRFAKAEEVAAAVAFLASPAAAYINGINLPVDGGRLPTL